LVALVAALVSEVAALVAAVSARVTSAATISGIPLTSVSPNNPPEEALFVAPVKLPGLAGSAIISTLSH
jgi:hypothetical protein